MLRLKWGDIDLEAGTLTVRRSLERVRKGGLTFKEPKTARSRRTVVLPAPAIEVLNKHRIGQGRLHLQVGTRARDEGLVFARSDGRALGPTETSKAFALLIRKAGLGPLRFHDRRHTHVSILLKAGVGVRDVADRVGHSSPTVTLGIYSHALPGQDREAAVRFEAALRAAGVGEPAKR